MTVDREHALALARDLAARGHLIGAERRPAASGPLHTHRDPGTGRAVADLGLAGPTEVDDAVDVARAALPAWRALAPHRRAALLDRLADLLDAERADAAALTAVDNGTPVSALDPGRATARWVRYYGGWVDKLDGRVRPGAGGVLDYALPEPYGVVAAVVPWNGPMMGMGQKAAPALAAGNTVVAKPPEIAPFGALRFAELALEAGFPPGVVNVVVGGAVAGAALVRHPGVDKITFTGGAAAAQDVMTGAAEALTPVTLELGGKSANIVFPDADLEVAATNAGLLGAVLLSSQGCALPTRLFIHEAVADEVLERLVVQIDAAVVGDPLDPATLMGPLATEAARDRVLGVVAEAVARGATLRTGGRALGAGRRRSGRRAERGLVPGPDRPHGGDRRSRRGPARGVRPRAQRPELHRRGRGRGPGQRPALWPGRLRAHPGPRPGPPGRPGPGGRHGHRERLPEQRPEPALRRGQAERLRPRRRPRGPRRVLAPQEHPDRRLSREGGI